MEKRIEEEFLEVAEFIGNWCNGGSNGRLLRISDDISIRGLDGIWRSVGPKEDIGRNDPCPFCLEKGIRIKWKKCRKHSIH